MHEPARILGCDLGDDPLAADVRAARDQLVPLLGELQALCLDPGSTARRLATAAAEVTALAGRLAGSAALLSRRR